MYRKNSKAVLQDNESAKTAELLHRKSGVAAATLASEDDSIEVTAGKRRVC